MQSVLDRNKEDLRRTNKVTHMYCLVWISQSSSSRSSITIFTIPLVWTISFKLETVIANALIRSWTLSKAALCWSAILFVFRRYISKQLLNHLSRNLMHGPSLPASLSKTHAYTLIECVEINFNSASEILGFTSCIMNRKYFVTSDPVKYWIPFLSL